ncbi:MAG TPA: DNA recombination protein RmuC [Stellaceae bacterium]|nr:DNA recombination protein RmuC [Stellaceae bacterium]
MTLGLAALALAGVALAVALVLLARFSRLANGLSAGVEPALLRLDQGLRDELARGRSEAAENARLSRAEVTGALESVRGVIEGRLEALRADNNQQLERMRQTVDEKLQSTLQERLGAGFKLVADQLEQVTRGVGEMRALADGVGDLRRVLSNVKARGTWGEVSLGSLLDEVMAPEQYARNVEIRPGSRERVEFAIRLPGGDGGRPLWLPIDAKFPIEDYGRLAEAAEAADAAALEAAARAIEARIVQSAREISAKYVAPPHSTDFALLFLPTEGLYAEVLRRPGLVERLQRDCRIVVAGPTTLLAILNSLRMGFRTLAIQERTSEVWQVLGAVKTEFGRFGDVLDQVQRKLHEASATIDRAGVRRRAIERKLADVETLPEHEAGLLLGLDAAGGAPPLPDAAED